MSEQKQKQKFMLKKSKASSEKIFKIKQILKSTFQNYYTELSEMTKYQKDFLQIIITEFESLLSSSKTVEKKLNKNISEKQYININKKAINYLTQKLNLNDVIINIRTKKRDRINKGELGQIYIRNISNNNFLYFRTYNPHVGNFIFSILYNLRYLQNEEFSTAMSEVGRLKTVKQKCKDIESNILKAQTKVDKLQDDIDKLSIDTSAKKIIMDKKKQFTQLAKQLETAQQNLSQLKTVKQECEDVETPLLNAINVVSEHEKDFFKIRYNSELEEIKSNISTSSTTNKSNLVKLLQYCTESIPLSEMDELFKLINIIEEILIINIILIGTNVGKYVKQKIYLNKDKLQANDNPIIILYFYHKKSNLRFEPVININIETKLKKNFINNLDNKTEYNAQKKHFISEYDAQTIVRPTTKPTKSIVKPVVQPVVHSIVHPKISSQTIVFNPYDKDQLLPIIEFQHSKIKYSFLLGHEINGYHVLYDTKGSNNIAGKVILDKPTDGNCSVFLCK